MTIVRSRVVTAPDALVTASLVGGRWRSDHAEEATTRSTVTDETGVWQLDLPSLALFPAGAAWRVTTPGGTVGAMPPIGAEVVWLDEVLVDLDTLAPIDPAAGAAWLSRAELGVTVAPLVDGKIPGAFVPPVAAVDWGSVQNRPSTFPPSVHQHQQGEVVGLGDALAAKASAADLAPVARSGQYADLTGRPSIPASYADLSGTVPVSAIPAVAITEYLGAVSSQAAMLALVGQRGDWCYRTDRGTDWQLVVDAPALLGSWQERHYPGSPVSSVAGRVGAITLTAADVGLDQVANLTPAALPVSDATAAALAGKVATGDPRLTNARPPSAHAASHATGAADPITPAAIGADPAGAATAAIAGHVAAGDPHTQYQRYMPVPYRVPGPVAVQNGTARWYNDAGRSVTLAGLRASVSSPPSGSALTAVVRRNGDGGTVFASVSIPDGAATATSSPGVAVAAGDYLTVDVTAVGATAPGANLSINLLLAAS